MLFRSRRRPGADHRPGRRHGGRRGHRRDGPGRPRTRRRSHGRGCARSGREAGATPRATGLEHRAATPGAHAGPEPVLLLALPVVGLERPLHDGSLTRGGPPSSANCGGAVPGAETRSHPRGRAGSGATWPRACGRPSKPARGRLGDNPGEPEPGRVCGVIHRWRAVGSFATFALPARSIGLVRRVFPDRVRPEQAARASGAPRASTRCGWVPWIGLEWG